MDGDTRTEFVVLKSGYCDYVVVAATLALAIFVWRFPWPSAIDMLALIGITGL